MNKRIKYLGYILTFIFSIFLFRGEVYAANATITLKPSTSTVIVGNTVKVTATISSASALGSWDFAISYDTSKLTLTSSTAESVQRAANVATSANKKSVSYTFTFKAKASGSANVSISSARVVDFNSESDMTLTKKNTSIKVMTQAELEATYSKNNYLKSLSVEGATLTPEFNKETLEYSIELEPETTSIKVNATKEDSTASVTGDGEIQVSEGDNKIEVSVTAQNGNVRKYVINAKVRELSPIEVDVDGKKYTVIRKREFLPVPKLFEETTITINEEEVPAFKNEATGYTLIGLKDEGGNSALYIYELDKDVQKFTLYQEYVFEMLVFNPLPTDEVPKGYIKAKIKIGEIETDAYKVSKTSKFSLIYGVNIENGKKGWYLYDSVENTLQRYYTDEMNLLSEKINSYSGLIIGLGVLSGVLALVIIIICINILRKRKKNKLKIN